jgi:hypothetical protein
MKQTATQIRNRAIDLVGVENVELLERHGLVPADRRGVESFLEEHRKSNQRIRETAAAAMRALDVDTFRLELAIQDGIPIVIATAPSGNEEDLARVAGNALVHAWVPPEGWTERAVHVHDTNDVTVAGAAEEPMPSLKVKAIVAAIVEDIGNRALQNEWREIGDDDRADIVAAWETIVRNGGGDRHGRNVPAPSPPVDAPVAPDTPEARSHRIRLRSAMISVAGGFINVSTADNIPMVQFSCANHEIAMEKADLLKRWATDVARDGAKQVLDGLRDKQGSP